MSNLTCPNCGAAIPADAVNIGEGVALCRSCSTLTRLSALAPASPAAAAEESSLAGVNPGAPPRGCSMSGDGAQTVLVASARSLSGAAGALFFAVFWNGIVSVFVCIALASTIKHLFGSVPSWFPAPPMNSGSGTTAGAGMPLGMTIFLWVFLLPFIGIGLLVAGVTLVCLFGRVEARVRTDRAVVFTGFGPVGWRRSFDPAKVRSVKIGETTWKQNDRTKPVIEIEGEETVRFGSMLPEGRRVWLAAALREILVPSAAPLKRGA